MKSVKARGALGFLILISGLLTFRASADNAVTNGPADIESDIDSEQIANAIQVLSERGALTFDPEAGTTVVRTSVLESLKSRGLLKIEAAASAEKTGGGWH